MIQTTPVTEDSDPLLLHEQYAERLAVSMLRGASFTDCLRARDIAPFCRVTQHKQTFFIRGSDIYRLWHTFSEIQSYTISPYPLSTVAESLSKRYQEWLLRQRTKRYYLLSSDADLAWFERVCLLVIVSRIMEQKYRRSITPVAGEPGGFADSWAAAQMTDLMQMRNTTKETARLVHHIVKDQAKARDLIHQFFEELSHQIQQHPYIPCDPLPPLPPGMPPLFPLLQQPEDQHVKEVG
jgi:hypothetical protein